MNRKMWRATINPKNKRYFRDRQEAVEWANAYYEKTGIPVEIEATVVRNRRVSNDSKNA